MQQRNRGIWVGFSGLQQSAHLSCWGSHAFEAPEGMLPQQAAVQ